MEMDYKYLSQILTQKYSCKIGIKVLSDLSYSDVKELIENITDNAILMNMLNETEKIRTDRDLSHIRLLISKRIKAPSNC